MSDQFTDCALLRDLADERAAELYAATVEEVEQDLASDPLLHYTSVQEEAVRRIRARQGDE